ncbi:hypothetical protein [Sphingomonas sp.]|uniref:hypothetical protein n=1 Tax=Sphingomonas sp. TaxID=28214 RepID=UPI003CC59D47
MSSNYTAQRRYLAGLSDHDLVAAWRDLGHIWTPGKIQAGYDELHHRGLWREAQAGFAARRSRWRRFYGLMMLALVGGVVLFVVMRIALL